MRKLQIDLIKLKSLYDTELSLADIAKSMGISLVSLRNKIKELGWKRQRKSLKIKLNIKKIEELQRIGLTTEQILQKLKISRTTLIKFEKENGLYIEDPIRKKAYLTSRKTMQEKKSKGLKAEVRHSWSCLDPYKDDIKYFIHSAIHLRQKQWKKESLQSIKMQFVDGWIKALGNDFMLTRKTLELCWRN